MTDLERENEALRAEVVDWDFRSDTVRLGEECRVRGGWEPFAATPAFDQARAYALPDRYVVWLRRRKEPTP